MAATLKRLNRFGWLTHLTKSLLDARKMEDTVDDSPPTIQWVDKGLNNQLLDDFTGEKTGFVQIGPEKYFMPSKYATEAKNLYNFKPRPDDTWVVTFPRSGTTWTQELVWLILNDLNFETAGKVPQTERFPFFEFSLFMHNKTKAEFLKENESNPKKLELIEDLSTPGYELLNKMVTPRFIKTHLPFSLLPKNLLEVGCKVIYVARNSKDVAVSFYHLNRLIRTQGYRRDFITFWDYFERGLIPWAPYWSHIKEGWKLRFHPNVMFLFYEDMNKDIKTTINRTSQFLLGRTLSIQDTDKLANYLDIVNFQKNPAVNYQPLREAGILVDGEEGFIRKGKTGGWVEQFTPELSKRADKWINDNLKDTDLQFPTTFDTNGGNIIRSG